MINHGDKCPTLVNHLQTYVTSEINCSTDCSRFGVGGRPLSIDQQHREQLHDNQLQNALHY